MKTIIKNINKELKEISKEFDTENWNEQKIEHISSGEAYNRGYYRALQYTLNRLEENIDSHQTIITTLKQGFKNPSSTKQADALCEAIQIYTKNTQEQKAEFLIQLRDLIIKFTK